MIMTELSSSSPLGWPPAMEEQPGHAHVPQPTTATAPRDRSFGRMLAEHVGYEFKDPAIASVEIAVSERNNAQRRAEELKAENQNLRNENEELHSIAYTDSLTGLANRLQITQKLEEMVETNPGKFAVWFIDVDGLKTVNDTEGHEAGNELIRRVAVALSDNEFYGRMSARLSGDEFVVLEEIDEESELDPQEQLTVKNHHLKNSLEDAGIEASTGAILHTPGQTAVELIELADQAMYQNKEEGRDEREAQKEAEEQALEASRREQVWASKTPKEREAIKEAQELLRKVSMSPAEFSWLTTDDTQ